MFLYTFLEAILGIVLAIFLAVRTKKSEDVIYGRLDNFGRLSNALLAIVYGCAAPGFMFLGMISEPRGEGFLVVIGAIIGIVIASSTFFCALGLGLSVALRKKGKSRLSFAAQFMGAAAILLSVLLYCIFVGSLISPLN